MRGFGGFLIAVGALMVFGAFNMSTSVYSYGAGDVNNLGLLQKQLMVLQTGLALFVAGSVLFGAGTLYEQRSLPMSSNTTATPVLAETDEEREEREERLAGVRKLHRIIGFTMLAGIVLFALLISVRS